MLEFAVGELLLLTGSKYRAGRERERKKKVTSNVAMLSDPYRHRDLRQDDSAKTKWQGHQFSGTPPL